MWLCPKCGREFKRTNQGHYCGKAPENAVEYIQMQPDAAQPHLIALRNTILSAIPDARERIVWSMPTYGKEKNSVSFAACKNHVSLYVDSSVLEIFKPQLSAFAIKKNAIYLPYDLALPISTIENMIKLCFEAKR